MRPWQEFFPELERQVYAKAGFGEREPFGKNPAFLIIDVVLSFTGSRSQNVLDAIEEYKTACGEVAWNALTSIQRLLERSREVGIPVVFTKGDPNFKTFCGDSVKAYKEDDIQQIYNASIPDIIAPRPDEFVLTKTKASAFFATPLATYFHRLGIDTLLVAGTSTSGCVRATVTDAFSHGYKVFLVEECLFDRSEVSHKVNLFEMNAKYANVIQLGEALAYLDSLRPVLEIDRAGVRQSA